MNIPTPDAVIPLERNEALSIPFKVHTAAEGGHLAVLNTFGMPYAQQLLVVDTRTNKIVRRVRFDKEDARLFNLDVQLSADGATCVMVGGALLDATGQAFAPGCVLSRLDVQSGEMRQTEVGKVGYNFVTITPDGATAYVIYNGSNDDSDQYYRMTAVDLATMEQTAEIELEAPLNHMLFRGEGKAVVSVGRDVYDFDTGAHRLGKRLCPSFNHPYQLAVFPGDKRHVYAAYVASKTVVKTIDVDKRSIVGQKTFSWGWTASTNIVPFGDDHLVIPPGSSAGAICLWNRHTGVIDGQAGLPAHLILSTPHPDGKRFYLYDYERQALVLLPARPLFAKEDGGGDVLRTVK